jgi:4-hydroxy-tetrahydrodipicolinate synthase
VADFSGSFVAIVTPFRDDDVDHGAFDDLVEWQLEQGTSGIVVCGTTGEAATLHPEERDGLVRRAREITRGRCPLVVGTGTNDTRTTVALSRSAAEGGADALLVVTPYYNKPTQAGLEAHFRAVAAAGSGCPVILYDVPGRTGVTFEEGTLRRLAQVPDIVALKDATHDHERAARLIADTPLTLLSGDDGQTLALMQRGAAGVISVAANVVPAAVARLCADRDPALDARLQPLFDALFVETNPIPVKFGLAEMGRIRNEDPSPVPGTPVSLRKPLRG